MAGSTRAAAGAYTAIAGTAFLLAGEVTSLPIRHDRTDDTGAMIVGAIFGLGVMLSAVGFLILGRESLRSGRWHDWRRFTPLATGLWTAALVGISFTHALAAGVAVYSAVPARALRRPLHAARSLRPSGARCSAGPGRMTGAAIDLAPARRPRLRRLRTAAGWLHLGFAGLIVTGVFVQVYLIGAYIFGAGEGALDLHKSLGYTVHGFEVLLFILALVAWLPRTDLLLSLLVTVIGTAQIMLAESTGWMGGLHPLGALVVLTLAAFLAQRGLRRQRTARGVVPYCAAVCAPLASMSSSLSALSPCKSFSTGL